MEPATALPTLLSVLFKSAEQGTLTEIVETAAKLVRLIEPLLAEAARPSAAVDPAALLQGKSGLAAP